MYYSIYPFNLDCKSSNEFALLRSDGDIESDNYCDYINSYDFSNKPFKLKFEILRDLVF